MYLHLPKIDPPQIVNWTQMFFNTHRRMFGVLLGSAIAAYGCFFLFKKIQRFKNKSNQNSTVKFEENPTQLGKIVFSKRDDSDSESNLEQVNCFHYSLIMKFDFSNKIISTSVILFGLITNLFFNSKQSILMVNYHFKVLQETNFITLDIQNINIFNCILNGKLLSFEIIENSQKNTSHLRIQLPGYAQIGGIFELTIKQQSIHVEDSPIQWYSIGQNKNYLVYQGNYSINRHIFACQDSPSIKVSISSQLQTPLTYSAYTIGEKIASYSCGDMTIMNYEQRDPIPIHMISLFAGATDELEVGNMSSVIKSSDQKYQEQLDFIRDFEQLSIKNKLSQQNPKKMQIVLLPPEINLPIYTSSLSTLTLIPSTAFQDKNLMEEILLRAKAISFLQSYFCVQNLETAIINESNIKQFIATLSDFMLKVLIGFCAFDIISSLKPPDFIRERRERLRELEQVLGNQQEIAQNDQLIKSSYALIKGRVLLEDIITQGKAKNTTSIVKEFLQKHKANCKSMGEFKQLLAGQFGKKVILDYDLENYFIKFIPNQNELQSKVDMNKSDNINKYLSISCKF